MGTEVRAAGLSRAGESQAWGRGTGGRGRARRGDGRALGTGRPEQEALRGQEALMPRAAWPRHFLPG